MRLPSAFVPLTALLAGCHAPASPSSFHVDTLPGGIPHAQSDAPLWAPGAGWQVIPDLAIGGADSGPGALADVRGIAVDGSGRIYVLDAQNAVVQLFDSNGMHLRTLGRKGEGPGEFTQPIGLALQEGHLLVVDQGNARFTWFDSGGSLVVTKPRMSSRSFVGLWEGLVNPDGRILDHFARRFEGSIDNVWAVGLLDPATMAIMDTFDLPVFKPAVVELVRKSGGSTSRMQMTPMYTPTLSWVADPRGFVWFGVSDRFRVVQRRLAGDTVRVIDRAWIAEAVSDSARAEAIKSMKWFTDQGGVVSLSDIPTTRPAFSTLALDDEGNLWAKAYGRDARTWEVFDTAGRWLGPVEFPGPVRQLHFCGGRYYATTTDSLDNPIVARGRIQKAGEGGG